MHRVTVPVVVLAIICLSSPAFAQQGETDDGQQKANDEPNCTGESDRSVADVLDAIDACLVKSWGSYEETPALVEQARTYLEEDRFSDRQLQTLANWARKHMYYHESDAFRLFRDALIAAEDVPEKTRQIIPTPARLEKKLSQHFQTVDFSGSRVPHPEPVASDCTVRSLSSQLLVLDCKTTACSPHGTDGVEVTLEIEIQRQKWSVGDTSVNKDYGCGCIYTEPML